MTRLVIDNSGRSGVIANMTVAEFKDAVYHSGTDEDQLVAEFLLVTTKQLTSMVLRLSGYMTICTK